jgi:hypothetical protein
MFVDRLQIGVRPPQFAFETQATHIPTLGPAEASVAATQTGVEGLRVLQASEFAQPAQVHVFVSQIGFALSRQSVLARQPTHVPLGALTAPSDAGAQNGVVVLSFMQASFVLHASHAPASMSQIGMFPPHLLFGQVNGVPPVPLDPAVPPTPPRPPVPPVPPAAGAQYFIALHVYPFGYPCCTSQSLAWSQRPWLSFVQLKAAVASRARLHSHRTLTGDLPE